MTRRSLQVQLPLGWYEVEGNRPRSFRRHRQGSGILQISLQAPPESPLTVGEEALAHLDELLAGLNMPLGLLATSGHEPCAEGVMAFAIYKHPQHGLLQFWVIPSEVQIFATWQMGSLATAVLERLEAHEILRTVRFEDSDISELLPDTASI